MARLSYYLTLLHAFACVVGTSSTTAASLAPVTPQFTQLQHFHLPIKVPNCTDAVITGFAKCAWVDGRETWRIVSAWWPTDISSRGPHEMEMSRFGPGSCPHPELFLEGATWQRRLVAVFKPMLLSGYTASAFEASFPRDQGAPMYHLRMRQPGNAGGTEPATSRYYAYLLPSCVEGVPPPPYHYKTTKPPQVEEKATQFAALLPQPPWDLGPHYVRYLRVFALHYKAVGFTSTILYLHPQQYGLLTGSAARGPLPAMAVDFIRLMKEAPLDIRLSSFGPKVEGTAWEAQGLHIAQAHLAEWGTGTVLITLDQDELLYLRDGMSIQQAMATMWKGVDVVRLQRLEALCGECGIPNGSPAATEEATSSGGASVMRAGGEPRWKSEPAMWAEAAWPPSHYDTFLRLRHVKTLSHSWGCYFPASVHSRRHSRRRGRALQSWFGLVADGCKTVLASPKDALLLHMVNSRVARFPASLQVKGMKDFKLPGPHANATLGS